MVVRFDRYCAKILPNGDAIKQLMARSRYLLYGKQDNWSKDQHDRAALLFYRYPDIQKAYDLSQQLSWIFNSTADKLYAFATLAKWNERSNNPASNPLIQYPKPFLHHKKILNYFDNRSINASAASFNTKIKAFRSQFKGVGDINFFLFRLTKLFA